jgi:7-cyano-7-deazaguanine synthase
MPTGTVVLMGGGIDSSYVVSNLVIRKTSRKLAGIHFDYGQPAARMESVSAGCIAGRYGVAYTNATLNVPMATVGSELKGRNMLLVLAAASYARTEGFNQVAIGIHAGTDYYDASPRFLSDAQRVLDGYFGGRILLTAPLLNLTKAEIWLLALADGLPVESTYSCLTGTNPPCGTCPSCIERNTLNEHQGTM